MQIGSVWFGRWFLLLFFGHCKLVDHRQMRAWKASRLSIISSTVRAKVENVYLLCLESSDFASLRVRDGFQLILGQIYTINAFLSTVWHLKSFFLNWSFAFVTLQCFDFVRKWTSLFSSSSPSSYSTLRLRFMIQASLLLCCSFWQTVCFHHQWKIRLTAGHLHPTVSRSMQRICIHQTPSFRFFYSLCFHFALCVLESTHTHTHTSRVLMMVQDKSRAFVLPLRVCKCVRWIIRVCFL